MFKPPKMQIVFFVMCLALRALAAPETCNECFSCLLSEEDGAEEALNYALGSMVGMDDMLRDHMEIYTYADLGELGRQYPCDAEEMSDDAEDGWPCMALEVTVFDGTGNDKMMLGNCRILTSGYSFLGMSNMTDDDDEQDVMDLTKNAGLVKSNLEDSVNDNNSPVGGITVYVTSCLTDDCNSLEEKDKAETTVQCGTIDPDADDYLETASALNDTMYDVVGGCCSGLAGCTDYVVGDMVVADAKRQRRSGGQERAVFFSFELYLLPGTDYDSDDISESYELAVTEHVVDATGWDTELVVVIERGAESSTTVSLKASLITLLFAVLPIVFRF